MDLKKLREQQGLRQSDVAIACNVSLTTYRMWELGVAKPKTENLEKLKKVLGVE
jgi:transcriptional regulator with XRE-family HTH domain